MEDITKDKIIANAKIGVGILRIGSGVATGCGVGLLGGFFRHRQMMDVARRIAVHSIKGGKAMLDEGLAERRALNDHPTA
jgi:hypothetical protein